MAESPIMRPSLAQSYWIRERMKNSQPIEMCIPDSEFQVRPPTEDENNTIAELVNISS